MGVREVATLAEVDLAQALGVPVSSSAAAAIVALDVRLDRLERGPKRYGWALGSGFRVVAALDQHPWGALGRVVAYRAGADDLFELSVDVWRRGSAPLEIQTTVVVGCFCETDHEIHTVADQEWTADSDVEVRDALIRAVTTLEGWVALDLDPDGWRARAGLPPRPGPRAP